MSLNSLPKHAHKDGKTGDEIVRTGAAQERGHERVGGEGPSAHVTVPAASCLFHPNAWRFKTHRLQPKAAFVQLIEKRDIEARIW